MPEDMTFEQAIIQLEKITAALENGQLQLDESMKYYEQGIKLADFCTKKLDEAKLKITKLTTKAKEE